MAPENVIELSIPGKIAVPTDELEHLRSAFASLLELHYGSRADWRETAIKLEIEGWDVQCSLTWHVEARRKHDFEEACGATRAEAYRNVFDLTRMDVTEGCT
ncbi:MAG: hypothetical protein HZB25_05705 [Candidatus Eisenbacteria bacterium]|nr:hypothetical protein [Candidatus Eisenbacteria bacterium]